MSTTRIPPVGDLMFDTKASLAVSNSTALKEKQETRFCTIVDVNDLRKIRIIANREGLLIKAVVGAAFTKAISGYEAKHGPIESGTKERADNLF